MKIAFEWPPEAVDSLADAVAQRLVTRLPRLALQKEMEAGDTVDIDWVAERLGVCVSTIRRRCDEGRFPMPKGRKKGELWKWSYEAIREYLP